MRNNSYPRMQAPLQFLLIFLLMSAPVLYAYLTDIWMPCASIWETFGIHYKQFPSLLQDFNFIGNAMTFTMLYAYPITAILHHFNLGLDEFEKAQIFMAYIFIFHALLCATLYATYLRKNKSIAQKGLLILCLALPQYLAISYLNVFNPNYTIVLPIFFSVLLSIYYASIDGTLKIDNKFLIYFALFAALFFTTKINLLGYCISSLAVLLWYDKSNKTKCKDFIAFGLLTLLLSAALLLAYHLFNIQYLYKFVTLFYDKYTSAWLIEHNSPLLPHIRQWINFNYPIQVSFLIALLGTLLALYNSIKLRSKTEVSMCVLMLLFIAQLYMFLSKRLAANTFYEAISCNVFIIGVTFGIIFAKPISVKMRAAALIGVTAFVSYTAYQVFFVFNIQAWVDKMQQGSVIARQIDNTIMSYHGDKVYYISGFYQNVVFPSPLLYKYFSGDVAATALYLQKYYPDSKIQLSPEEFVLAEQPHLMVVSELQPQYVDASARDAKSKQIFLNNTKFHKVLHTADNQCKTWHMPYTWTEFNADGAMKVTICSAS